MPYRDTTRDKPAPTPPKPIDRYAEDATGINVDARHPINPRMPHLPPA
jgi:hypothetical protein